MVDQSRQPSEARPAACDLEEPLQSNRSVSSSRVAPTNAFIQFKQEEIDQSIPERFEQQVARCGDLVAVRSRSHQVTYGELNKIANRIARAILAQCGKKEEPIALLLGHDATMIASVLGVLKSGKTCVPLEPAGPPARTRHILEDSETGLIVTNGEYLAAASELVNETVHLINIEELDSGLADENIGLNIPPETLAYILYTSGSTGQPKGVTQTHRNVLHSVMAYVNSLHIQTNDRLTLLASCSGGQGIQVAISALVTGATLCLWNIPEEGLANLADWLITEAITVYISGATVFRSFIATLKGGEQFPSLRVVRLGNEPVRQADLELYKKHFSPDCIFVNWFAATETGNIGCYFDNKRGTGTEFVPVGYAFEDIEILLLDDDGHHVGFNQTGEIVIKSRYLSPGYWHQPDLTRARFLPDPNGGEERLFLSGDLGFMLPDGCLYHVGRKDFQVKVRGNRIEVGEVESALLAFGTIRETVVVAEDQGADTRLVAYIVPAEQPPPSVGTLRRALAEKLPEHMIPSAFVLLDGMPVTSNGKVNRQALPRPERVRPNLEPPYLPANNELEEKLVQIWEEVLDVRPIGIHDNFFDLGGHSLLGVRLISRAHQELHLDLPIQSLFESLTCLFESLTIAQLAASIKAQTGEGASVKKQQDSDSRLIKLQTGHNGKQVFCFPYFGGFRSEYFNFTKLARLLGPAYSFYGLRARGTDGVSQPHRCVEDMAADYVAAIQVVQSHGPYYLLGECGGEPEAYETAQQLTTRGEKVALLAFLDARAAGTWRRYIWLRLTAPLMYRILCISESWAWNYFKERTAFHLSELRRLNGTERFRYFFDKAFEVASVARDATRSGRLSRFQRLDARADYTDIQRLGRQERQFKAYWLAVKRYRHKPYNGRITVLANEGWYDTDSKFGWARLAAGGLEVHRIPGNHDTYITDNVHVVAAKLKECLEREERKA